MDEKEAPEKKSFVTPRLVVAALVLIAAVWFVVANRQSTRVHLWAGSATMPLWMVLALTFVAGWLTRLLTGRRHKK